MKTIKYFALFLLLGCANTKTEEQKITRDSATASTIEKAVEGFKPNKNTTGGYEEKYPNGVTKVLGNYRFGKKDGVWATFYPTGQVWSENQYKNDSLNGTTVTYFETGQVRYTGFHKNDKPSGLWQFFDTTGKVVQEKKY
jgi:antitoxin component YwqK of YwqJK toxin-antitoxin module